MRTIIDATGAARAVPCDHDTATFNTLRGRLERCTPPFPMSMADLRRAVFIYAARLLSP